MAPKPPSKAADYTNGRVGTKSFMKDYLADWDDDDPFRSPSPEPGRKNDEKGKKRDKTDVLGIEKELNLKKKPRAPRVKLDDTRSVILATSSALLADPLFADSSQTRAFPSCERWQHGYD